VLVLKSILGSSSKVKDSIEDPFKFDILLHVAHTHTVKLEVKLFFKNYIVLFVRKMLVHTKFLKIGLHKYIQGKSVESLKERLDIKMHN
jgi:hypothetical protein